jgi:2',3'-cyclic-nucleotide 2'-phosphodiesterase (5'-nucleotidase family)
MFELTMDNLLLDATAAAAGTTVALSNGWRYGAPIAAGPFTEWDLWNMVPANSPVSVVTLTGRQLRELLEQNVEARSPATRGSSAVGT